MGRTRHLDIEIEVGPARALEGEGPLHDVHDLSEVYPALHFLSGASKGGEEVAFVVEGPDAWEGIRVIGELMAGPLPSNQEAGAGIGREVFKRWGGASFEEILAAQRERILSRFKENYPEEDLR